MNASGWTLLGLFLIVLGLLAWPIGRFLAALCDGRLPRWMQRAESPLYRLAGVSVDESMHWRSYALALLAFNALGALVVYGLQRLQAVLPLNPAGMAAVSPDSSFNTAVAFVTNTNWQGYAGESTMSYLTQMLGLSVQNFLSAATGIAVAFALARGFAARPAKAGDGKGRVGNFWVDITRITAWLLLPISFAVAVFFVAQGVIQNFDTYQAVHTVEGATQTIAMGPVASQEAIKMIGTNGGGFFNANSAHPYENPTALANFVQMLAIFLIPAALCFAFGRVVGDLRQGWAVLAAMTVIFVVAVAVLLPAEQAGNPLVGALGVDQAASALQSGGNMEGKEVRFGIQASALFAAVTTAASCGAVNAMHDSLTP
ncbi:MAG: potassium-transporting ATPase subunit KdpA, partial [Variovorax sp.]